MNPIDFIYEIVLLPTVTLYNYLPYIIRYQVDNSVIGTKIATERTNLEPGESAKLINARTGTSYLLLEMLNYANTIW